MLKGKRLIMRTYEKPDNRARVTERFEKARVCHWLKNVKAAQFPSVISKIRQNVLFDTRFGSRGRIYILTTGSGEQPWRTVLEDDGAKHGNRNSLDRNVDVFIPWVGSRPDQRTDWAKHRTRRYRGWCQKELTDKGKQHLYSKQTSACECKTYNGFGSNKQTCHIDHIRPHYTNKSIIAIGDYDVQCNVPLVVLQLSTRTARNREEDCEDNRARSCESYLLFLWTHSSTIACNVPFCFASIFNKIIVIFYKHRCSVLDTKKRLSNILMSFRWSLLKPTLGMAQHYVTDIHVITTDPNFSRENRIGSKIAAFGLLDCFRPMS
ncbi:hypothetical protein CLF_111544 [Clonorchis sinensis]|uniref:Uncharacterized protein n=1 Tax=Clonorchis sinensis TaxID=79923 RepID=G7YV16_CLOSI|nr:hypothetical protein CLF_111544 [Clonorchis sinensis]